MSTLFLLKSDHDNEKIGDVIVALDKIISIRAFTDTNDEYCLSVEVLESSYKAWFKDKVNFTKQFKELICALDGNTTIADEMTIEKIPSQEDRAKRILNKIQESMSVA